MTDQHNATTAFGGARRAANYVEVAAEAGPGSDERTSSVVTPVLAAEGPMELPGHAEPSGDLAAELVAVQNSDDLSVIGATKPPMATKGLRGMLAAMGMRISPGPDERASLARRDRVRRDERTIRQATWTRAQGILVANPKGGAGKTPTALCIGGVMAAIRGGSVAIVEVADDRGTLTFRAEGTPKLGVGELVRDIDQMRSAGQLAGYTAPQTSFASVIGTAGRRPRLNGESIRKVARTIDEFYTVRVMDSGNQPSSSAFTAALEVTDALVIPVLNSADSVLEAIALLEHLRAAGGRTRRLADSAVVIKLTDGRPEPTQLVRRLESIIKKANVGMVCSVPYDEHIAERGQITMDKLAPATREAFVTAAASVVRSLQSDE